MLRRFLVIGVVFGILALFTPDAAEAGRLGGAYRGPYGDEVTKTEEETSTDVGGATSTTEPTAGDTGGQDSGGGGSDTGGGGAVDGGGGDSGGGDDGSGAPDAGTGGGDEGGGGEAPPPDAGTGGGDSGGGDSGGGSSAPSAPSDGPGSGSAGSIGGGSTKTSPGGQKAVIDQKAFWAFWFEHNKEWILAELLRAKSARASIAPGSGGWYFSGAIVGRSLTPVTDAQRLDDIFPVLANATTHESSWVRDAAVLAMGKLGSEKVIPYLLARIEKDPDTEVQEDALLALGLLKGPDAEKKAFYALMKVLQEKPRPDSKRKAYAALGLALLGNSAAVPDLMKEYKAAYKRGHDDLASVLAIAIGHLGQESDVADLAQPLKFKNQREGLKVHVCQALSQIGGDTSRDQLLRALTDREAVQAAAVLALSRFPDARVAGALLGKGGLKSGLNQIKAYATVALGRIGRDLPEKEKGLKKKIRDALKESAEGPQKNIYASMYAALGLAIMGDDAANDFFEEHLKKGGKFRDENYSAMAMAAGLLPITSAAPDLRKIVKRGGVDQDYQGYACFALGVMGDDKSKADIVDTMKKNSRRKDILRSACWALGLLGDETDVETLIGNLTLEGSTMHEVRGAAAIALGLIGDGDAVAPLVKMAKNDPVSSNRAFAIAALGCLIDKAPVPRIPQLFENIHYRKRCPIVEDVMRNL